MTELQTALQGASTITGSNNIYRMEWPDLRIKALITRVKANSNNEIHGEIDISSERPTSAGHLKGGKLNITSVNARHAWAGSLTKRDSEIDWDALLEQLYLKVKNKHREGAPVEDIDGDANVLEENAAWVIEPILLENNITLIYGHGSAGKSWFAQFIALISCIGMSHAGFHARKSRVLYLDYETTRQNLNLRVSKIKNGLGITDKTTFKYRRMTQSLVDDIESVNEYCEKHDINMLIIDSVGLACGGEPENAKVINDFAKAIRSLRQDSGMTTLLIDHMNKEGLLFGSIYKFTNARLVWEVKKNQETNASSLFVGLFHKKANDDKLYKEISFELTFSKDAIHIERKDVRDTPLDVHLTWPERVTNIIRVSQKAYPQGMTAKEIAEELKSAGDERTEDKITNQVSVLFHNDKNSARPRFVRMRDRDGNHTGKWGLAASPDHVEEEKTWQHQAALKETVKEIVRSEGGIQSLKF